MKVKITLRPAPGDTWCASYEPWFSPCDYAFANTADEATTKLIEKLRIRYAPRKTEVVEI